MQLLSLHCLLELCHKVWFDLDPYRGCPELRRGDADPAVAATKVVHAVVAIYSCQL